MRLQPDLVILNFSPNDLLSPKAVVAFDSITRPVPLSAALFANPSQIVAAIDPSAEQPPSSAEPEVSDLRSWLKQRVRLYDLAALRWHQLLVALGARAPAAAIAPEAPLTDYHSVEWEWLRDRFLAMQTLLAAQGAGLVIWSNYAPAAGLFGQFGEATGIPVLDVSPLVRSHPDAGTLFRPWGHFSGPGNQLVAEALHQLLVERHLLP